MNGAVARNLRKEVYPKDYSKRDKSYTSTFIEKIQKIFWPDGSVKGKYKLKKYQIVCVGMRNLYLQKKKEYMRCQRLNLKYKFSVAVER